MASVMSAVALLSAVASFGTVRDTAKKSTACTHQHESDHAFGLTSIVHATGRALEMKASCRTHTLRKISTFLRQL